MILQLKRWLPDRKLIVTADSSYSCYHLLDAVRTSVCMITRLRLDARLFDFPPPRPKGKRGPNQKVGQRQPTLQQRLDDANTQWQTWMINEWYGQKRKIVQIATGKALWYKGHYPIVPIRWVLIKDPDGQLDPVALLCTDLGLKPLDIICFFIRRWPLEVTFEEVRTHLGVESQRQWSDMAIARTTPALMDAHQPVFYALAPIRIHLFLLPIYLLDNPENPPVCMLPVYSYSLAFQCIQHPVKAFHIAPYISQLLPLCFADLLFLFLAPFGILQVCFFGFPTIGPWLAL